MEPSFEQSIGKKLRNTRILEGLTQREVAKKCGISVTYLCDIEKGRVSPSFKVVGLLMETLGYEIVLEKSKKTRMTL